MSGSVQTSFSNINFQAPIVTSSSSNIPTDFDIFPVGDTIDPTNYVYDGVTVMNINTSLNPCSNYIKAQYFNPVTGAPDVGFSNWNYDLVNTSYLNGTAATSTLLGETTLSFNNLQSFNGSLGTYNIDITNGGVLTPPSGNSNATMFFSLTSQPYYTYQGNYSTLPGVNNVIPGYTGNNSDNFIFTSDYYVQQKNEIIQVQFTFTVSNTDALNVNNTTSQIYHSSPTITLVVTNKIISKEVLSGITT